MPLRARPKGRLPDRKRDACSIARSSIVALSLAAIKDLKITQRASGYAALGTGSSCGCAAGRPTAEFSEAFPYQL